MGGQTFDNTTSLSVENYVAFLKKIEDKITVNYLTPIRLSNKPSYSDIDFIVFDEESLINDIKTVVTIKEQKIIPLFGKSFNQYSKHILTDDNIQIDLLKPWNENSLEITRAYYSYSFANIFFTKIIDLIDANLTLSYLGIICSSNKIKIPENVEFVQLDNSTRIILDVRYLFELMDLNYERFLTGFADEFEFLNYLKTSKYYSQIEFRKNSKFGHNIKRLQPFRNLYENGLLNMKSIDK